LDLATSLALLHNISHSSLAGSAAGPQMSIDKLFPALLECFGIIMCGYIAERADIITETQAKGLGNFVSKFALPALLFKNMVLLDFGDVIWAFLWSVLVAKVTVFVLVCVLTLMVASPESRYSKAGLYAIFATQSNDFALGYPIVEALYRSTYPEYLQYIYLVAPVSLMILNPIGFALCEIQRWRQASHPELSYNFYVDLVFAQVLKNPIVFMVIIGIVSHFALGQQIPAVLSEFIDGLANSFGGAALFYLGLSMVGQLRKLTRDTGVALILLITAKLLVMPLVCKDMVEILDVGVNSSSPNHTSLSNFAFLYGVFPTAPSVAIYAAHYNMELEVVTSGMVISTFLSAPIMYVSAWLLTIPLMDPTPLITELQNVSFNISVVCLLALVWTIAVMLLSRKFNRLPHVFALNLFLAQFLVCVSMILWNFLVKQEENLVGKVITFSLLYGSLYSTYIWTGDAVVLAVSLLLGALSLMGLSQGSREQSGYEALGRAAVTGLTDDLQPPGGVEEQQQQQPPLLISSPSTFSINSGTSWICCFNLSSCMWWLLNRDPGRLYLELQFFCAVANYGQGFLSFGIFGLDRHLIILPFKKRLLSLWHGRDSSELPSAGVPEEVRLTCTQFVRYHKEQCVQDVVHTRSTALLTSPSSLFRGSDLVEWLLERGLCKGRGEAQMYGGFLQQGGVIEHETGQYGFKDEDTIFYYFTNES
uniref:DEP domain-containing protein n=1 Tax=Periophthalmus magnuspinnatus TaxID=409849 RepID=A0A3B4A4G4_9GOBI